MSKITAAQVNELRKTTGAGMMDCKKALVEAEGDKEKAIEILRKKGQKVAAKRGDRDATEGLVIAKSEGKEGVILVLNCETDFVAKNDDFGKFANQIVDVALQNKPTSVEELKGLSFDGNGLTIGDKIIEEIGKIGEKIDLSAYELVKAETVVAYNHPGNKIASIVGLSKDGDLADAGKDVAMQIAAMAPIAIDEKGVEQSVIDKELEIGMDLARQEGKPEAMLEKIAQGKLKKFFKENTLLNQQYIKDNKKSVGQFLNETSDGLTVTSFKRLALG